MLICLNSTAQTKPVVKSKIPVVKAYLGTFASGTYTIAQLKLIVDNALILKDDKGNIYPIKNCSFLYKRKMIDKDETTGKTNIKWEYNEKILKAGEQLDEFWRKTIKEELQEGEELIFGRIMADSKKGYSIPVANISFVAKK